MLASRPIARTLAGIAMAVLLMPYALAAHAQGNPTGKVTTSFTIAGLQQASGAVDLGGDAWWNVGTLSAAATRQMVPALTLGVSAGYSAERWRIDAPSAFAGAGPWRDLRRVTFGTPITLALSKTVLTGLSPYLEWAGEQDVAMEDALTYGTVVSALKVFSPRLVLGAGTSVSRQFYSVKVSPFAIVNWRIGEHWRLANAFPSGPLGGAGIELRHAPDADWEIAAGGVLRSDRWRLSATGAYPDAIGEKSSMPMFGRVSRRFGPLWRADVYAGAFTDGRLRVKDSDGNELVSRKYAASAAFAATLSFKR